MKRLRDSHPRGRLVCRRPLGTGGQDPLIRDWLTHAHSLTARIRASSQVFAVKVLYQGRARAHPLERAALASRLQWRGAAVVHVREVLLMADGQAVVWARTVLPQGALRGSWRFLGGLGSRPLGERLFTDPAITRTPFAFLPAGGLRACRPPYPPPVAVRRALLDRQGMPALLTEALLPAIAGLRPRRL